jgi:hypothetical protein
MWLRRAKTEGPLAAVAVPATALALGFSATEWRALLALRARYQRDCDLFADQGMRRLRFTRWLVETGRLTR